MRLTTLLLFLTTLTVSAQDGVKYTGAKIVNEAVSDAKSLNASQNDRKFAIVEYYDKVEPMDSFLVKTLITKVQYITDKSVTSQYAPGDTARLYMSQDGRPLVGSVTWKYADQKYDTTFIEKERIDDPAGAPSRWGITNISKATNVTGKNVFNKTFSYVTTTGSISSAKIVTEGDVFELFSERFNGHGYVKVFIDDQQVATLYQGSIPYVTDFDRMIPSFRWIFKKDTPTSPAKSHTIELKTDPGNQYIIDMLRVLNYTLKPR